MSSWTPGCGSIHPQANLIWQWARGEMELEQERIVSEPQLSLRDPLVAREGWMPVDFPTFNPNRWMFRERKKPEMMALAVVKATQEQRTLIVREDLVAGWDRKNPQFQRITEWVPVKPLQPKAV